MKLIIKFFLIYLATEVILASNWFSKSVYNKWHETELERWLSDNNIPYPSQADRKELEKLISDNWLDKVSRPYLDWDTDQLKSYLKEKGIAAKDTTSNSKDSLISQIKSIWYEKEDKSEDAWSSIKEWIFDSWSDSALKSFAVKHGISVPEPQERDSTLQAIRSSYDVIAKKTGDTISYPGNWLYDTWSESDLKEWLDSHGFPVPQLSSRDKLIASVRRNSRIASLKAADTKKSASNSAENNGSVSETILKSWSDSQLKQFLEKKGVPIPNGSKTTELLALVRKYQASLTGDKVTSSVKGAASQVGASGSSAFGAATSGIDNQYGKATDKAQAKAQEAFDYAIESWSDTRLKAFLDSRGVPVPQAGKRDELLAAVRLNKQKAVSGWSAWTFDTWSTENLKKFLATSGNKASQKISNQAGASRDQLLSAAQDAYATASKSSGSAYASVTSYFSQQTDAAKDSVFDTWSESELKNYLDSYGVPVPQGSSRNSLIAWARNQRNYFQYGSTTPQGTLWAKLQNGASWAMDQVGAGRKQAEIAADKVKEKTTYVTHRADEAVQKASDKIKEEL